MGVSSSVPSVKVGGGCTNTSVMVYYFLAFGNVQMVSKAEAMVIHVVLSHLTAITITKITSDGKNGIS
jgi:hypothetical protein